MVHNGVSILLIVDVLLSDYYFIEENTETFLLTENIREN